MNAPMSLIMIAIVPMFAGMRAPEPAVPVTIYVSSSQPLTGVVVTSLRSELADIMHPAGIRLEWRRLDQAAGREVSLQIVVVTFKGTCDGNGDVPVASEAPGVLGKTFLNQGEILPFTEIDCDRIHALLQPQMIFNDGVSRNRYLGRAVARVLAHELYHVFVKTPHHAALGLAKAKYTAADLTTSSFYFDQRDYELLRSSIPRDPVSDTRESPRQ